MTSPLEQLADIKVPDEVSFWPLGLGYWIVLVFLLLIVIVLLVYLKRRKARLASKRHSIALLESIDLQSSQAKTQIHHVLKSAVQAYYPKHDILQLSGQRWQTLLVRLSKDAQANDNTEKLCALAKWQIDNRTELVANESLKQAAYQWLDSALPPKQEALDV